MKHYRKGKHFKGKVVFCNCDDPTQSKFWEYFENYFDVLKLKKLIATHYRPSTLFENSPSYKLEYTGSGKPKKTRIVGDGDFQSAECIEILKEADIVVTNPPFSLLQDYVDQLIEHKKKFLIIGNSLAIPTKKIFPRFKERKMWMGCSIKSGDREFRVPNNYPLKAAGYRKDKDGNKYIRVKGVRWFTNLSHDDMPDPIHLYKYYSTEKYPKYDNYDAIEVGKVKDIPKDYDGEMGVPVTFLDKYNPKQFEIIGLCRYLPKSPQIKNPQERFFLNGKEKFARIVIKKRKKPK